jgi:putative hydrolase of the HAD superfamily
MPPIALIFDFGGVLMKTRSRAPRLKWDDRLGLPHGTVERVVHSSESWRLAQIGQLSVAEYWADVARQLGITSTEITQLETDYFSADELDHTLINLIQTLRHRGHPVALLSNDSPALREKLHHLDIARLFDPLVISGEIGMMKPTPSAYHAVLSRMALPADKTVFIDDMPANISGAQAVGMGAIHYQDGMDLYTTLTPFLHT